SADRRSGRAAAPRRSRARRRAGAFHLAGDRGTLSRARRRGRRRAPRRPVDVRLLFVSPHYGTLGGVRLIIDALAAAALAAGHEVAAVVDGDAPPWAEPRWAVRFHPFPRRLRAVGRARRLAFRFPPTAGRLIAAVRRFAPDVVSVHCARFFAPYPALLRTATRAPQVVSLQEGALPADVPQNEGL